MPRRCVHRNSSYYGDAHSSHHCHKMAAYNMATSTLDFGSTSSVYNSRGVLYKLYRDHFGNLPVAATRSSPQPAPKYPPYGDQPETSSGSPTHPLDIWTRIDISEETTGTKDKDGVR